MLKTFSKLSKAITAPNTILFVVIFFVIIAVSLYREFMPDDTFIHIGYAKDISEGKGYSFAGNKTYGSTSPIWPPLIASLVFVHTDFENSAKLLSFLFSIASILLMYITAHLRFSNLISLCAALLFSFNAYFLRWSLTGMEATASCFFMLVLVYIFFKEKEKKVNKFLYFIAGLSPLIRPEFYLFIPVLFYFLFLTNPFQEYSLKLALTTIPALLWNCFAYIYFGTIVPSTFLIKASNTFFSTEWDTVIRSAILFLSGNLIESSFILIASIILAINYKKKLKYFVPKLIKSEIALFITWISLFYIYYILKNVTILSRYSLVLLPVVVLLTFFLLMKVSDHLNLTQKTKSILLVGLITASLLVHGLFTCFVIKPDADNFVCGFQREYKIIASIIAAEGYKKSSVALSDVGIIGVYSNSKIYDFVGLVDKDRYQFSSKRDYFLNKKPQYLILRGEINLEELKDNSAVFQEIYTTHIAGLGINQRKDIKITAYKVFWNQ